MKTPRDPYPRTAKVLRWVIGDVETGRQVRLMLAFCGLGAFIVGLGAGGLMPAPVVVAMLLVMVGLLVWLVRVAIAYTRADKR